VVVGDDHQVSIFDVDSGQFSKSLTGHTDWVRVARFSPNGRLLLTAGNDRRALMWNTTTWGQPIEVAPQPAAIFDCAFTPDSEKFAVVGFDSKLRLFTTQDAEQVLQLDCPGDDTRAVAITNDGALIAAAGRSGVVRVWETLSGRHVQDIAAHKQRIRSLQFTSTNDIVSCSEDQFVKISSVDTGKIIAELPRFSAKLFATALIDDQTLATSGSDNLITIWNLANQSKLDSLTGHTGTVSCLCAHTGTIVSGSYDTHVKIWRRSSNAGIDSRQTQINNGWHLKLK
jgi:WD40 repeat protein